jgi:hypothetical protein
MREEEVSRMWRVHQVVWIVTFRDFFTYLLVSKSENQRRNVNFI